MRLTCVFVTSLLQLTSLLTSSLPPITGDLAPSLLSVVTVMLVVRIRVAEAANYSLSQLQMMALNNGRGTGTDQDYHRHASMSGPNQRQLNRENLLRKLGNEFKSDWMSIEKPAVSVPFLGNIEDPELLVDLRDFNFTYLDDHGNRITIPSAVRGMVERLLLQRASCPIEFTWVDMGTSFWPRWVKHGRCDTNVPCSWPPGMHCAPAESDALKLMRWTCRRQGDLRRKIRHAGHHHRHDEDEETDDATVAEAGSHRPSEHGKNKRSAKMKCKWKKVPYPVTSECFCSC